MTGFGLANFNPHNAMGRTDALLASENEECLGAGVCVDRRDAARRTSGFVDLKEILGRDDAWNWPHLGDFGATC